MAMTLASLLVLFALTSSGFSLSCIKCINLNGAPCTVISFESCPSGSSCVTAKYVKETTNGFSTLLRGCVPNKQCNVTGSLTFTGGNVKISATCCDTDNCTTATPILPTTNTMSNNLVCSTCNSTTSDNCTSSETLQCTSNETKCGLMSVSVTGSTTDTFATRGCSTPSICDLLGNLQVTFTDSNVNLVEKASCSNGKFISHVTNPPKSKSPIGVPSPSKSKSSIGVPLPSKSKSSIGVTSPSKSKSSIGVPSPSKSKSSVGVTSPSKSKSSFVGASFYLPVLTFFLLKFLF